MPTPEEIAELCQRARRACDDVSEAQRALRLTRTHTEELIVQARNTHPDAGWQVPAPPVSLPTEPTTDADLHAASMEVLREMRTILAPLPA